MLTAKTIDINFSGLKDGPSSLQLSFPNGSSTTILKSKFYPIRGYQYRDDEDDPPGTPAYWPTPNASLNEFSYMWSGETSGYHVILTVHNGQMLGYINGNGKRYGIELRQNRSSYWIVDFNVHNFPARGVNDVVIPDPAHRSQESQQDTTYISHLKSYDYSKHNISFSRGINENIVLDMLIVWQEAARIEAGGSPFDSNDTQRIDLLIATAVNHTNEALERSKTNTRVTKFHTAKLNGFNFSGQGFAQDVRNFRELSSINQLRDLIGADVVSGIVESDFNVFDACGAAFTQTIPNPDYSPGATFNPYSYNLVTEFCAIWDNTFVHELGHNMGCNHTRSNEGAAAVNAISNNGYPYAFGHDSAGFQSLMSTTQLTVDRELVFSDPGTFVNGNETGVLNEADNARVIDELSPAMAEFRARPNSIFENGFE